MTHRDIKINHNAERYGGGTFTYGSESTCGVPVSGRYGGAFKQPNGQASLVLSHPERRITGISSYRRAQRLLLQHLKGYNV